MSNENGWIGVDLDGTLAHYDGWKGIDHVGEPIPKMAARVKKWLAEGKKVKIFTARVCRPGRPPGYEFDAEHYICRWSEKHFGVALEVTNVKDFDMIELWDDRAVAVECNTGVISIQQARWAENLV